MLYNPIACLMCFGNFISLAKKKVLSLVLCKKESEQNFPGSSDHCCFRGIKGNHKKTKNCTDLILLRFYSHLVINTGQGVGQVMSWRVKGILGGHFWGNQTRGLLSIGGSFGGHRRGGYWAVIDGFRAEWFIYIFKNSHSAKKSVTVFTTHNSSRSWRWIGS